jgi:hypothetical protein
MIGAAGQCIAHTPDLKRSSCSPRTLNQTPIRCPGRSAPFSSAARAQACFPPRLLLDDLELCGPLKSGGLLCLPLSFARGSPDDELRTCIGVFDPLLAFPNSE